MDASLWETLPKARVGRGRKGRKKEGRVSERGKGRGKKEGRRRKGAEERTPMFNGVNY